MRGICLLYKLFQFFLVDFVQFFVTASGGEVNLDDVIVFGAGVNDIPTNNGQSQKL